MKSKNSIIVIIKVIANSQEESIEFEPTFVKVKVNTTPFKGRANRRLLQLLSERFEIALTNIKILRGKTSSIKFVKLIELKDEDYRYLEDKYKRKE